MSTLMQLTTMYTLSRCRRDEKLYGRVHGSSDCEKTHCGMDANEDAWMILSNDFTGIVTCRKCLAEQSKATA
jgi:hypothetical protein